MGFQLKTNSEMLKDLFFEYEYNLYNNNSIEELLLENYPEDIINTYRKLKPYSNKCDFARYCILFKKGGWYFDLGLKVVKSIQLEEKTDLIIFRDINFLANFICLCPRHYLCSQRT